MITLEGFEKINTEKKWEQISLISGVLKFFFLFFFCTSSYNWPTTRFEDCSLSHNNKACVETSDLFLSRQHAWRLRSAPRTSEASCSVNQRLWYHVKRANMTVLISSNVIYLSSICWPLKLFLMDEAEVLFWTRSRDYQLMFFCCWQIVGHDLFSLLEEMS